VCVCVCVCVVPGGLGVWRDVSIIQVIRSTSYLVEELHEGAGGEHNRGQEHQTEGEGEGDGKSEDGGWLGEEHIKLSHTCTLDTPQSIADAGIIPQRVVLHRIPIVALDEEIEEGCEREEHANDGDHHSLCVCVDVCARVRVCVPGGTDTEESCRDRRTKQQDT